MVNKFVAASAVAGATLLGAAAAQATVFTGDYTVTSFTDTNGTGLNIVTQKIAPSINLNLTQGQSSGWINLFRIWTTEEYLHIGDDLANQSISVSFTFTAPPPPFGAPVGGTTDAAIDFWFIFPDESFGRVAWNDPIDITFGALDDGILRVWLSDEEFNEGDGLNLTPGEEYGATVQAKFKLIQDATVVVAEVAEPATFGPVRHGPSRPRRNASAFQPLSPGPKDVIKAAAPSGAAVLFSARLRRVPTALK